MNWIRKFQSFLSWYAPVLLIQVLASRVTLSNIHPWYRELVKASWTPPAWLFGPVWTVLYLTMALSVWWVYLTPSEKSVKLKAYAWFFGQLLANGLWSFLFFAYHLTAWALLDLTLLLVLIGGTMNAFHRIRPGAAYLLLPYFLWTTYALSLNAAIWYLN